MTTAWRITIDNTTWTDDDLTGADAVNIAVRCGDGWRSLDPFASPVHLVAIAATLAARTSGLDYDAVALVLLERPAADLLAILEPRKV